MVEECGGEDGEDPQEELVFFLNRWVCIFGMVHGVLSEEMFAVCWPGCYSELL